MQLEELWGELVPDEPRCIRGKVIRDLIVRGFADFKQDRLSLVISEFEPSEFDVVHIGFRGAQIF